jgi:AmmeMemoRadiSam system protein A
MALSASDHQALQDIARQAIRQRLAAGGPPRLPEAGPLAAPAGAFVTLRLDGELRGSVGVFTPGGSLARAVAQVAAGAVEDPRFAPVRQEEIDRLGIEVSVLGPRRRMHTPDDVQIGRDGLVVQLGWRRGALLPRAAAEAGWDPLTFLQRTCLKAGLPPRAWQDSGATVELFAVDELGAAALPAPR